MLRRSSQTLLRSYSCISSLRTTNVPATLLKSTTAVQTRQKSSDTSILKPNYTTNKEEGIYQLPVIDFESIPPVEVADYTAVCDGDPIREMGHPTEFIRVNYDYAVYVKFFNF